MKNYTTPRTLAECQWVAGYETADLRRNGASADRVILVLAVVAVSVVAYLVKVTG